LSLSDEWSVLTANMKRYEWDCSPVRMFPLTKENETIAEELISSHTCKIKVFESKLMIDKSSDATAYNLHFGHPGSQVPVEQDLKQKIILVASDSQKTSFTIPRRKYPKFRFTAKLSQGTLSKGAIIEIELTLRLTCTTSVKLDIPIIFWQGNMKDFEKAMKSGDMNSYVCFFHGDIHSKLSRRLILKKLIFIVHQLEVVHLVQFIVVVIVAKKWHANCLKLKIV